MNTTHTPSPWFTQQSTGLLRGKNGEHIATIHPVKKEQEANARLIAAAPELLEALQNILSNLDDGAFQITVMDDGEPHAGNLDGIRDLIKKNTGQ